MLYRDSSGYSCFQPDYFIMNYAERELLKAIARAVAIMVRLAPGGGGYHATMINEKLQSLEAWEEAKK